MFQQKEIGGRQNRDQLLQIKMKSVNKYIKNKIKEHQIDCLRHELFSLMDKNKVILTKKSANISVINKEKRRRE